MIEALAPAKLTLSLRITGVRHDGYHEVDAEMVTLDFCDRLEISEGGSGVRMLDGTGSEFQPVARPGENLVERALALAGRQARVTVHKRIPVGAGLGGGSADAAAVLRWAKFTDTIAAASIGADVAFCLAGGRARVRGIGEIVEPLPYVVERYTLLLAPVGCDTAAVYTAWDELGGPVGEHGNDLEAAALRVVPELGVWRDQLGDASGLTPRLAGSGSTWFVAGAHPGPGRVVVTTTASSRPPV
ncbi:MAG: 4-(cytidine 5'-diphospho)-2-C-methyl-D-erythritol kinase [Acidimicrobiaceae bacterium]|nr:4-(cytidine 5'-diphospho)-2-C-methyl-D-erythritol kinase [Acidimicrobiaceae bacterium]